MVIMVNYMDLLWLTMVIMVNYMLNYYGELHVKLLWSTTWIYGELHGLCG